MLVVENHFLARFWEPKIWMQTKKYRPRMQLYNSAMHVSQGLQKRSRFWAHILVVGNHFLARFWEPKIWMQTKKYLPRMQLYNSAIAV